MIVQISPRINRALPSTISSAPIFSNVTCNIIFKTTISINHETVLVSVIYIKTIDRAFPVAASRVNDVYGTACRRASSHRCH